MKQTLNMGRQLAMISRYCYSARGATQNMLASRSLPITALDYCDLKIEIF